jgi:GntR family transcriptional regulator
MPRAEIDRASSVLLYEQLAEILRDQIASGQIAPDHAIPSRETLTQRYGISSKTADAAVAILKAEGLLVTVRGKGHYVVQQRGR